MSMIMDVDVDIYCGKCGHPIHNEDDIICNDCHNDGNKETLGEVCGIMEDILPYVNEATLMKPVMIPGDFAFMLREKIRVILNKR